MSENAEGIGLKIGTMVATMAAGWLATRVVGMVWQKATGGAAPDDVNDETISAVQAVTFAAVSGGVAVLARRMATRGTQKAAAYLAARPKA